MIRKEIGLMAITLLLLVFAGCNLSNSPSQTAKSWIDLTEKGNTDEAMKLFSNKAMQERGAKLKTMTSSHVKEIERLQKAGKTFSVEKVEEKITGETAKVSLIYRAGENDSLQTTFDLIQENGSWKVNGINEPGNEPTTEIEPLTPQEIGTPIPTPKEDKK